MLTRLLLLKIDEKLVLSCVAVGLIMLAACATPVDTTPSHTRLLNPDEDDQIGGSFIESSDIRTIAQQMCAETLTLSEVSNSPTTVRIATERIKNSTRYMVDTNLLLRRLRLELNKYSKGRIRFFAQGSGQIARTTILKEREEQIAVKAVEEASKHITSSVLLQNSTKPVRIAVSPVANTNLFNMNADSFSSLLRSKIKERAGDSVLFARPGSGADVDYTLTGEFFALSTKGEGVASTVEDLKWAQENPDKWYDNEADSEGSTVYGKQINVNGSEQTRIKLGPNAIYKLIDPALWNSPNVTKIFNVMLVDNKDMAVLEKTIILEEQITSGQERADYILTGDLSSLSKATRGQRSDYVLISLYLIDPVTNEMLWEYGYEVKRVTSRSVLYR